jgi:hypothetical protein
VTTSRRLLSSQTAAQQSLLSKTRNIGIIAHIDAVGDEILVMWFPMANELVGKDNDHRAYALL